MSPAVRSWFEQMLEIPTRSRVSFLQAQCPDTAVRAEVLSLLRYDSDSTSEVPVPLAVKEAMGTVLGGNPASAPAPRVGPFQLGRLLGSGGMGFVYEAQRVDGEVRQRVAVKFAQVAPGSSEEFRERAHRRFHRERQMLASLRHPYISSLIDAGATADGIPYAVIEQVDGVPIDTYCDTQLPDPADRIRLVLKLCDAVQFAHRNLIVHSDIKPDNVLVTADGIPKLIDFGVASDLGEDTTLTMRGFTPGYASPEQSHGLPPTVATDVYGIGAVLYRLLTGAKPRQLTTGSLREMMRHISEEDVVRPSTLKPELKGDLENILLKALQREPHRRYGSVPELADDLNRYLARRPVRATPDSTLYRASRFLRRHWAPVLAVASLVVALATATIVSLHQREEAMRRAAETRRLADRLLFEVHDEIGGLLGGTKAREKLGAIAVEYLEALQRDHRRDPELAWELVNAYARLGQSRGGAESSIGHTRDGLHLARRTLELGAVVEAAKPDADRLDRLFGVYESLVPVFQEAGRPDEQRETIDRMLRLAQRLQPLRQAQAWKHQARYLDANGSIAEATGVFERALAILRTLSLSPAKPASTDSHLTSTLVGLGRAQGLTGDFTGAVRSLQEAIRLSESCAAADRSLAKSARQLYWSHISLGDVFGSPARFSLGRANEAAEQYRKARAIAEKLVRADPANEMAKLDLARTFSREAAVLAVSQPDRSLELLDRFHALALETSPRNHSGLTARYEYLTGSIAPLVELRDFERARHHMAQARRLAAEMRQAGVKVSEASLLKAEAIRLYAAGQRLDALAAARKHLALLPEKTSAVLSQNFEAVDLLERMRVYAAGLDDATYRAATERLIRIWDDLRRMYPQSEFVIREARRIRQAVPAPAHPSGRPANWQS